MSQTPVVAPSDRLDTLPEGLPSHTLGYGLLAWAGVYLTHPDGPRAGQSWRFTKDQARFLLWLYSINPRTGQWNYTHGLRCLAKGSGKTPFAAVLAVMELLGPTRLDRFDDNAPGKCVGKPVEMPYIELIANSQHQAATTMSYVRSLLAKTRARKLHDDYQLDVGKHSVFLVPNGELRLSTSSFISIEGKPHTFAVGDELEHWTSSNGGLDRYDTIKGNLSKTNSLFLGTMNAWVPGRGSMAEHLYEQWEAQELGRTRGEQGFLWDGKKAHPSTDLADEESLQAALDYVYGGCPWIDTRRILNDIWTARDIDAAKRKFLNWPTASSDAWVDPQDWQSMARPDKQVCDGEPVVLFFDGSLSNDHTALIGARVSDGHIFTLGVWEPVAIGDEQPRVDVSLVDGAIENAFQRFDVQAFFADVREWESFTKVIWPGRYAERLRVWAVPEGRNKEAIAWDMRTKDYEFTTAAELVETDIYNRSFTHDGHPLLSQHVYNARRYQNRYGNTVRKEARYSPKKIDACVAMIGARMVWRLVAKNPGEQPKKNGAFFL